MIAIPAARAAANQFPPGKMTFQGFLTDDSNVPLGNAGAANFTVRFLIYDAATTGNVKWAEEQVVTIDKGHFSVLLGEGSPVSPHAHSADLSGLFIGPDASERWMGISVTGLGGEITPRIQFFAAPYAQLARAANTLVSPNGAGLVTAANGALTINGTVNATSITASVDAGQITGGNLADARLSANVALLNGTQTFTGAKTFNGLTSNGEIRQTSAGDFTIDAPGIVGGRLKVTAGGNVGIGANAPGFPLTIRPASLGDKISLWGNSGNHYGFGIQGALLQIHTDAAGADVAFGHGSSASFVETMRIKGNGKVGIGTATPRGVFDVASPGDIYVANAPNGGSAQRIYLPGDVWIAPWSSSQVSYVSAGRENSTGSSELQLRTLNNGSLVSALKIDSNGRVGIGTTTPGYPLHVQGSVTDPSANGLYGFFNHGDGLRNWPGNHTVSIFASDWIRAYGFLSNSDRRTKDIEGPANTADDLKTIRQLQVTRFRMIDTVQNGDAIRPGFIAQEVERVVSSAVAKSSGVIPDIYAAALATRFDSGTRALAVTIKNAHGLRVDDVVQLVLGNRKEEFKVIAVPSEKEFVVRSETQPERVFVYGRRVDDLLAVDYDHLFTTGIGAIQELAKQVEALARSEARIAELEKTAARVAALEAKAARVESMERELAGLMTLVTRLAEAESKLRFTAQLDADSIPPVRSE